jgi:hypothetical protein
MSMRRENIEEQAMRLRNYVSEAVFAATGVNLPMTQTLDQMVRAAAKAGVVLSISTEAQMHAIEMLSNQLRLLEISLQAENERLRTDLEGEISQARDFNLEHEELKHERDQLKAGFKNFHRSLCERFGYFHDEADWQRDQVSLEEHIATQFNHVSAENSSLRSQMETVQRGAGQLKAENEALRKERDKLAEDNQGLLEDFAGCL